MAVTIRKKLLLYFTFLILLSIVCQIVFNLFFAKSFFIYRKTDLMEKSYDKLKEAFEEDIDDINILIEDLQDDYGIRVLLMVNDSVLYAPDYSEESKKQTTNKPVFDEIDFSDTPQTAIKQSQNDQNGRTILQLSGKFTKQHNEIKVLMRLSVRSIDNSISLFTETSIYISLIVLIIGVIFSVRVSKTLSDPINSVELVSKKITMLDFSHEADENVHIKELSSLAKNINIMSEELQNTMEQLKSVNHELQNDIQHQKEIEQMRKDFIANVSHEMKTPLSLLQVYTENLRNNLSEIDRNYYYDTILEETEKLNQMISRMIEISSIDNGFLKMNFEIFSLTELCKDVLQQYHLIFEKFKLETKIDENIKITGDPKYLEQSVKNLLNNAVEHTAEGRIIRVSLVKDEDCAVFTVQNQCEKITEDGLLHVWDAFYRDDRSRTRTAHNNIGLGLYIVKTIIGKHNGTCYMKNVTDGVSVSIRIKTTE